MITAAELLDKLQTPAERLVEAYFRRHDTRFAGELFNTFGSNPPLAITPDDLLAVGFLDEAFKAEAALTILETDLRSYEQFLREIPPEVDLWDADEDEVGPNSAAWAMWTRLDDIYGVGPVRAGKLMARKRPRLIPIWDSATAPVFDAPDGRYWASLKDLLGNEELRRRIEALRPDGVSPLISTLRLLDVALWMRESRSEAARGVRGDPGVRGGSG